MMTSAARATEFLESHYLLPLQQHNLAKDDNMLLTTWTMPVKIAEQQYTRNRLWYMITALGAVESTLLTGLVWALRASLSEYKEDKLIVANRWEKK